MKSFDELMKEFREASDRNDALAFDQLALEFDERDDAASATYAVVSRGRAAMHHGRIAEAIELLNESIGHLTELNDVDGIARVRVALSWSYARDGRNTEALTEVLRAADIMQQLPDQRLKGRVKNSLGIAYMRLGKFDDALTHLHGALDLIQGTDDLYALANVNGNIGMTHMRMGELNESIQWFDKAVAVYKELNDVYGEINNRTFISQAYSTMGNGVKALTYLFQALDIMPPDAPSHIRYEVQANIGSVYGNAGMTEKAIAYFRSCLDVADDTVAKLSYTYTTTNLAVSLMVLEQFEEAEQLFVKALKLHEELTDPVGRAHVMNNYITLMMRTNREEEARALLTSFAEVDIPDPRGVISRLTAQATFARLDGDLDTAKRLNLEAYDLAVRTSSKHLLPNTLHELRDIARLQNDFDAYIKYNDEFQEITNSMKDQEATQRLTLMEVERTIESERRDRDRERAVLYEALPKAVADRLIRGEKVTGDHFDAAAVMFVDIVAFTTHTSHIPPADVVTFLDNVFATFDTICDDKGAMKIKTIGDAYLCFKGDGASTENAVALAQVALDIQRAGLTWPDGSPLLLRIGIHSGPVTAGVIGSKRLQYDVWGDTVNVASRMESTGEPGRIHVSEAFASFLGLRLRNDSSSVPHDVRNDSSSAAYSEGRAVIPSDSEEHGPWHLALRGETELKGKGMMTTYWLEPA